MIGYLCNPYAFSFSERGFRISRCLVLAPNIVVSLTQNFKLILSDIFTRLYTKHTHKSCYSYTLDWPRNLVAIDFMVIALLTIDGLGPGF